jgi:polygalacturonase
MNQTVPVARPTNAMPMFQTDMVRLLPALALALFASACTAQPGPSAVTEAAAGSKSSAGPGVFNVRTFGATGDGRTVDTEAIQKALDACAKAGGGTVLFPSGTYLSKPITLGNRTTMRLESGAVLKATDNFGDFLRRGLTWTDWSAITNNNQFVPFINGRNLTNAGIVGEGTIDGSGAKWWEPAEEARRRRSGFTLPRPNLIVLTGCKNLRMSGVKLINAPKFHFVPTDSEDIVIEDVTILAPERAANTDGIDPSRCRNVLITRCTIDTGDDNIAIKSGRRIEGREFACENIIVTDCHFLHGHGVSIGAETVGGVRNLVVKNCRFEGTENGIRIKSRRDRGGLIQDILYQDLTMTDVYPAISIAAYYQDSSQSKFPTNDTPQAITDTTPFFRNIRIVNLKATSTKNAGLIVGLPEALVTNVFLEDVRITAETGLTIGNAKGIQFKRVNVRVRQGLPVSMHNAEVEWLQQ